MKTASILILSSALVMGSWSCPCWEGDDDDSAGEADPRVAALMQRVVEFDALLLPGTTDDAVLQEVIERKTRMAAVIADEAASLAGDPETAQAGRYVEALLADHMGVAIRAWHPAMPASFPDTPEGRSEFLALVEEQRDVLATPFEIRAVELYSAVVEADGDEGEGCPWAARARDALARLQR